MFSKSIGVFDSGVGGLSLLKHLMLQLPKENFTYFADSAHLPYGSLSPEKIIFYSLQAASFLKERGAKALVIACNTATAYALNIIEAKLNIPTIGIIQPTVMDATRMSVAHNFAILATEATIKSKAYEMALQRLCPVGSFTSIACPLLVSLVENEEHTSIATLKVIEAYLRDLHTKKIDTLILGCTHYTFLRPAIQKVMGKNVTVVDSVKSSATETVNCLKKYQLLANSSLSPILTCYVSGDENKFAKQIETFLQIRPHFIHRVKFED